ncbi:MAG: hypothetical protein JO314_09865, partial [Acidobacteria bacterium]|nr:hypothetical protein [Acidobacteriota bacterium]
MFQISLSRVIGRKIKGVGLPAIICLFVFTALSVVWITGTKTAKATSTYAAAVLADSPNAYWRLGDSGPNAVDSTGNTANGSTVGTVTFGTPGALGGDPDTAATFGGSGYIQTNYVLQNASGQTIEAWVKTTESGFEGIVSTREDNGSGTGVQMFILDGTIRFEANTDSISDGVQSRI